MERNENIWASAPFVSPQEDDISNPLINGDRHKGKDTFSNDRDSSSSDEEEGMRTGNASNERKPSQLFVYFPNSVGIAFAASQLPNFGFNNLDTKGNEIEIPPSLLERDDRDRPYDMELGDGLAAEIIERDMMRIHSDLKRRKNVFMLFLGLEILYSCILIVGELALPSTNRGGSAANNEGKNSSSTSSSSLRLIVILCALVLNICTNILTIYGTTKENVWIINIFLVTEGCVIAIFLFNFSPLVLLRMVVFLVGAQVRMRIIMLRNYAEDSEG